MDTNEQVKTNEQVTAPSGPLMPDELWVQPNSDISVCSDPDSSRYSLGHVLAFPGRSVPVWLAATDGRRIAIVPSDGRIDRPILIPGDALKTGHRTQRSNSHWITQKPGKSKGVSLDADDDVTRFPSLPDCIPDVNSDSHIKVTLDAELLAGIARSIGSAAVTLYVPLPRPRSESERDNRDSRGFRPSDNPILVAGAESRQLGVLMPMSDGRDTGDVLSDVVEFRESFAKPLDGSGVPLEPAHD